MSTLIPPLAPPASFPSEVRARWLLDPAVTFLNHGCFGARLRAVSLVQQEWRERFEARPVHVLERRRNEMLDEAKRALGNFLGMAPENFGFTTNATEGVNAVLRSLRLERGDQVATTNHVYNAVRQTMRHLAERAGAEYVEIEVPVPVTSPDAIVARVAEAITPRTRLLVIDHVTSPTAIRCPVEALLDLGREHGVDVLVDGAHAPGMLPLDVEALDAAYYAGNLHKWVGAPPGAGFLWVRPDRQDGIHPTVISHFLGEGLAAEFSWQGTRDISPWLCVPAALEHMGRLDGPGSWPRVMSHNHELAAWVQATLAERWQVEPLTPPGGSMLGSMASLPVPAAMTRRFETPQAVHDALYDEHRIEVPVFEWNGRWLIRPSCQVYNTPADYERLAEVAASLTG